MRVLLLTTHLEMGGIPVYVVSLAQGLKRRGHEPEVISSGGRLEGQLAEEGIRHFRVPCRTSSELNPKLWLWVLPRLLRRVREFQPDVIHAHTRVMQVLSWAASALTGVPFVSTCHGLYKYRVGRRLFRCWGRWVMAISGPSRDRLVEQYRLAPPHQVILVVNGIEVDRFREPVRPEEALRFRQIHGVRGAPVIGAIARLSPVKGLNDLLKAVPLLRERFPRLQVLIVGDGPARAELVRLSYELGIADSVVLSRAVSDTRIPLSLMDVFVSPALREGFGLSIVEAMAAGVPVVATDSGGPGEILQDGVTGLLVPPADPKAVAQAIGRLLGDPAAALRIAAAGRRRAEECYDMRRVVQEVEAVYARACA